jgi:hypothetical protein
MMQSSRSSGLGDDTWIGKVKGHHSGSPGLQTACQLGPALAAPIKLTSTNVSLLPLIVNKKLLLQVNHGTVVKFNNKGQSFSKKQDNYTVQHCKREYKADLAPAVH